MSSPVLCFDIETVPDVTGLRALNPEYAGPADDNAVVAQAIARRQEKTGSDFLPLHQHRIVAIGCLLRTDDVLTIRCLGQPEDPEEKLLALFFRQIERYTPQLVSWNGSGFDLPVMNYRCLAKGIMAPRFWDMGEEDRDFKWNNYISRYHSRHLDLMDLLAMYSPRASAPLDELARICGFPGKMGMDGSQVWESFQAGGLPQIRAYCETDVANTYLMYCRFQLTRGHWIAERYEQEVGRLRELLTDSGESHWQEFVQNWP
ncbi:MAG: 3'-5' exonuclease [Burkholderiaceae bacterium]